MTGLGWGRDQEYSVNEGNIWRLTEVTNRSVESGIARGMLAKGPLSLYSNRMEHAVGNTALEH